MRRLLWINLIKCGGRARMPAPQETAPQETAPQETAPQETTPQETTPQYIYSHASLSTNARNSLVYIALFQFFAART